MLAVTTGVACRRDATPAPGKPQRIVSLVPAVTEMLFAIGAGPQVVGVSSYDHFPAEVEKLPKVGALVDPDTERILSLRPDLVVVYGSQSDVEARFDKAGIQTFNYKHGVTDAILGTFDTITALGAATGHEAQARELVVRITTAIDTVRNRVAGLPRPRTLLVIGRQPGTLQGIYAAGGSGFLNEMLEIAGGQNVLEDVKRESVQPSSETLLRLAPDVLVELKATAPAGNYPGGDLEVWNTLPSIPAVQNKQVHALVGDYVVVAGPRIALGAEAIARAAPGGVQVKILLSWSSGKDSAWALHVLRQRYPGAVAGLLTTINEAVQRVAMHAVRRDVLEAQAAAAGLPLRIVPIPDPCSNDEYESRMRICIDQVVREEFTHVAFGDLFLEDVRLYRERNLAGTGLTPLFPLWQIPTRRLADDMIEGGLRARVACVDTRVLDVSFAGREFDASLLADLPPGIDPCGENGEFHTCVYAGPMFEHPLPIATGVAVTRPPFSWRDFTTAA